MAFTAGAIGIAVAGAAVSGQQAHASAVEAKTAASHQAAQARALQQQYAEAQQTEQDRANDVMRAARARQRALASASLAETRSGTVLTSPTGVAPSTGAAEPFSGKNTLLGGI